MRIPPRPARRAARIAAGAAAASLVLGLLPAEPARPAAREILERVYERRLMSAADARCRLFTKDLAKALEAAALQARGAALRAGAAPQEIRAAEARADGRALALACGDGDLLKAAARVRDAFKGYADLRRLSLPGTLGAWEADRRPQPSPGGPAWRLVEYGRGPDAALAAGLADGEDLLVEAQAPQGFSAASARLIMRDPQRSPDPFFDPRLKGLAAGVPPGWLTTAFLARDIRPGPAGPGAASVFLVAFPPAAAAALRALDPRESVRVDLVQEIRTGERVRSLYFEVGDFAAGCAFLAAGGARAR
jgi:hypothetical protein